MFWFFPPSKKPTPSEYAVLVVFLSAVCIILGVVALVVGFRAPAAKHDLAVALEYRGACCLGIGVAIAFGFWLFHRIVD
jgi:NO-binding membrane sensor protein with MHYT domain